ncbi:PepSY domain-containing protein [Kocuria palustris]|uniref:PepSY domain-containing protein n=1 Tax=Kocuria palustris TaxID=71999 RepID=UPI0011A7C301|nr:PepSY domain-containing protein [Kocuria palustris]
MDIEQTTERNLSAFSRAPRRRSLGLALPALGLSALVLAGCGGGEEAAQEGGASAEDSASQAVGDDATTAEATDDATEDSTDDATDDASEDAADDASDDASDEPSSEASEGAGGGVAAGAGIPTDPADLDEILGAAEGTLDGSTAVSVEDARDAGWEVTVVEGTQEQEVRVADDLSTEVIETESDDDQDVDPASVGTSLSEAVEAASADQDGTVTEVGLGEDDGRTGWTVEFDDEIEVEVDADSGDVVGTDS